MGRAARPARASALACLAAGMFTVLHHPLPGARVSNPAAAPSPAAGSAPVVAAGPGKGVAAWNFPGARRALRLSGASWFYTWAAGPNGISAPAGARFVPMIWGPGSVTTANLAEAQRHG